MKACLLGLFFGIILTTGAGLAIVYLQNRTAPPVPELQPAVKITITLFPLENIGQYDSVRVEVPAEQMGSILQRLTPVAYQPNVQHDFTNPLVAAVNIAHSDGSETKLLVRDFGHNPALVTLNGRDYFVAREGDAGGMELIRLVKEFYAAK
ncbi:MAG: hypothetical protein R3B84_16790 [Zavarzinella sp.]